MPRRKRIFSIIQIGYDDDTVSRIFDFTIMLMILLNLMIAIVDTFDIPPAVKSTLDVLELITVVGFTIEYALRVWTADYLYPSLPRGKAILRYMFSFPGIVDLLSFLPYYLPVFFPSGMVAFRMLRVIRILRLFRINSYYDALNVIGDVIRSRWDQLLSSVFIIFILMIASSLCMYSLEHEAQPEVFRNAFSGLWWSVSTLLTVGYGDIYPITLGGKIFSMIITLLGVGMVAIPTGILSAGFVDHYSQMKTMDQYSRETNIRFVRLVIEQNHPWSRKAIKDIPLPPDLIIALILRKREAIVPRGETELLPGDHIVLGAEGFKEDLGITLRELVLGPQHPWVGLEIRELDISRQTIIVMVRRRGNVLVPGGQLRLRSGDIVLLYTKKALSGSRAIKL